MTEVLPRLIPEHVATAVIADVVMRVEPFDVVNRHTGKARRFWSIVVECDDEWVMWDLSERSPARSTYKTRKSAEEAINEARAFTVNTICHYPVYDKFAEDGFGPVWAEMVRRTPVD